jgi:hypothetical protein
MTESIILKRDTCLRRYDNNKEFRDTCLRRYDNNKEFRDTCLRRYDNLKNIVKLKFIIVHSCLPLAYHLLISNQLDAFLH